MDLHVVSFNIRGLNSRISCTRLKLFLKDIKFNVLFLQEHKLCHVNELLLAKQIWSGGKFFTIPAVDGTHALRNPIFPSGRGGIAIVVSHDIASKVAQVKISPYGRAIMLHIDDPHGENFGLLNIYGPHSSVERVALWNYILLNIDAERP